MAVADHFDTVQNIYIAFYQRPADPAGLRYWAERVEVANGDTAAVIDAFANSAEAQELYGDITDANIGETVTAIYQALFGRAPDAAGLAFYEEAFANGELSAGTIALQILDGARGDDVIALNNKLAVANEFTAQVDGRDLDDANFGQGSNFAATYNADDVEAAREILAGVTAAPGSVLDANGVREALQEQIANPGDAIGNANSIFTLTNSSNPNTAGVDQVNGTAGADVVRAVLANSLNSTDIIDGGAGEDVLDIRAGAISTTADDNAPVIRNVERVNNGDTATTLNLANVTGAAQLWTTGSAGTYTNANLATVFGASGAATAQTVGIDYAGNLAGDQTVNLAVNKTGTNTVTFAFNGGDGALLEGVSLNVTGASSVDLNALTALKTVTVDGEGRATVTNTAATITTFDASENAGGVTFTSGVLTAAATVTGGAGNDTFDFTAVTGNTVAITVNAGAGNDVVTGGAGNDVIDGGAGNDILRGGAGNDAITGGEGNDVITGGAGADTITLGAGNDVVVYAAGDSTYGGAGTNNTMDIIVDFKAAGTDNIDLSGAGFTSTVSAIEKIGVENAVATAVAASNATLTSVLAAATAVAGFDAGEVSWFEFGGNTYVVGQAEDEAADLVIELTGSVDLTASDFTFGAAA